MSFWDRTRDTASRAASATRRGARRARLEFALRRIERAIRQHKAHIGEAVYPLVKTGAVTVDLPEVQRALAEIDRLNEELERTRQEIASLGESSGGEAAPGETS